MAAKAAAKVALQLTGAQIRQILRLAGRTFKGKKAPKLTSGGMRKARKPGAAVRWKAARNSGKGVGAKRQRHDGAAVMEKFRRKRVAKTLKTRNIIRKRRK